VDAYPDEMMIGIKCFLLAGGGGGAVVVVVGGGGGCGCCCCTACRCGGAGPWLLYPAYEVEGALGGGGGRAP
jgi:hypothetical protein